MNRITRALAVPGLLVAGLALVGAVRAVPAATTLHLQLDRSSPEADEMLSETPASVTLWFSQAPQMSGTSVRLVPEGGEPLELAAAKAKEDDPKVIVLNVDQALPDGKYSVVWRAMAQDGHTVRGDFSFMVHATR
ncbi:MAG: copper resistance protein CopC [Gemmatimonadota bacterium]|nr:copper resistance protein CopC [Gemmatimonadota bacterium]